MAQAFARDGRLWCGNRHCFWLRRGHLWRDRIDIDFFGFLLQQFASVIANLTLQITIQTEGTIAFFFTRATDLISAGAKADQDEE